MGAHEKYESHPCLHHDCLVPSKQIWNANGEAVQGKNAPNVGEKFSAYGGRGRGWPGYDANNQNAKKEMARELGGQESREVGGDGYHDPLQRQSFYGGALGQVKFLNPAGAVRVTHRGIGTQRWDTNGESLPQPEKIPPKPVTSDPHASLQGYLDSQIDQESSAAADEEDQSESQPTAAEAREGSEPVSDVKSSAQRQFYQSRKVGSKILGDSSKVLESMPEYTEKEWKAGKLVKVCDGTGCHWQRIEEGSMDTKGLPWDFNTDNNHDSGEEDAGRPDVVQYPVTDFSSQSPGVQRDGKVLKPGVVRVCDGSAGCVEQMDFHHLHEAKGEKTGQPTQLTSSGQMQLEDSAAERTVQYVKDFLRSENITKMSVESIQAALSSVGLNVSADEIRMEAVELGGDPDDMKDETLEKIVENQLRPSDLSSADGKVLQPSAAANLYYLHAILDIHGQTSDQVLTRIDKLKSALSAALDLGRQTDTDHELLAKTLGSKPEDWIIVDKIDNLNCSDPYVCQDLGRRRRLLSIESQQPDITTWEKEITSEAKKLQARGRSTREQIQEDSRTSKKSSKLLREVMAKLRHVMEEEKHKQSQISSTPAYDEKQEQVTRLKDAIHKFKTQAKKFQLVESKLKQEEEESVEVGLHIYVSKREDLSNVLRSLELAVTSGALNRQLAVRGFVGSPLPVRVGLYRQARGFSPSGSCELNCHANCGDFPLQPCGPRVVIGDQFVGETSTVSFDRKEPVEILPGRGASAQLHFRYTLDGTDPSCGKLECDILQCSYVARGMRYSGAFFPSELRRQTAPLTLLLKTVACDAEHRMSSQMVEARLNFLGA
uniref:Uncharacterized protein n=1 Tax=Hanusia phi TaxID=3032 RepID=A0A7S0HA11_9CRYP